MLIQVDKCVFDSDLYKLAHGFDNLDEIGKESFVNHIHYDGKNRVDESNVKIDEWIKDIKSNWKGNIFRIYRQIVDDEITVRMHKVRPGIANWSEEGLEIIELDG